MTNILHSFKNWFLTRPLIVKLLIIIFVGGLGIVGGAKIRNSAANKVTYQTAKTEKGDLIISVTASGQVSGANSAEVTTQSSGVVKKVYVKDGDTVKTGDKIADIDLDLTGQQRAQQAYASYQSAQNNLDTAKATLYSMQSTMLSSWQKYMDKAQNSTYQNGDNSPNATNRQLTDFVTTQDDWLSSEGKYKVQQNAITQAQTSLSSAWYSYQQTSPTIVSPISGTVTGLSLQPGSVITAQTNASGGSSSQRIASVKTDAPPTISLNLTQIDAPKVKVGNHATITFDAMADKTFTGEVVSIDTIGQTSSGVTTYPAIVKLDSVVDGILPSMTATANIITLTKSNVLLVPVAAVSTQNGQSTVQVMRNGYPAETPVEVGLSSDTQTEIVSGIAEGDAVVTGTVSSGSSRTQSQTSIFSAFGRGGGGTARFAR